MAGVRRATHLDTNSVVDFLEHYHKTESNLTDIPFDKESMAEVVNYYVGMPKHVVFMYEDDAKQVRGVLIGGLDPFAFNKKRYWASDLIFVANAGGAWLMKRFIAWSKLYKVDRIIAGVSSGAIDADELYTALGFTRVGGMYSLEVK